MTITNKDRIINVPIVVDSAADTEITIPSYLPSIMSLEGAHAITLSDGSPNEFSSQELTVVTKTDDADADEICQYSDRSILIGNSYDSDSGAIVTLTYKIK
ncbi:MAG: hypothetical protein ACOCQD_00050 [archaeon]